MVYGSGMNYQPDEYDKQWLTGHGGFPAEGFNPEAPNYEARMQWRKAQGQRQLDPSLSSKVVMGVIIIIVGLLALYFAGGWSGLMNSKP